jgi:hypothetical protein
MLEGVSGYERVRGFSDGQSGIVILRGDGHFLLRNES